MGESNGDIKKKLILTLYENAKTKLTPDKYILLLEDWIVRCVDSQEYEMAQALKEEKNKLTGDK